MTAEQIKEAWTNNPDGLAHKLAAGLRGFGYAVTDEWAKAEITGLMAGEAPRGGPSMFLARWIKNGIEEE